MAAPAPTPPGMVTLDPERGGSVTLILNAPPDRDIAVGGWESSERAQRRPAKWFKGRGDDTMSLDCTVDVFATPGQLTVEQRLGVLRAMGEPDGSKDPPTIMVRGDVWDSDTRVPWLMTSMKLGGRLWLPTGALRRQQVTLEFERATLIDEVEPIRVKSTRATKKRRRTHTAVTRAGETLRTVAIRELGSAKRWRDLQKWNKKLAHTDPDTRLRTGTHVSIKD